MLCKAEYRSLANASSACIQSDMLQLDMEIQLTSSHEYVLACQGGNIGVRIKLHALRVYSETRHVDTNELLMPELSNGLPQTIYEARIRPLVAPCYALSLGIISAKGA